MSITSFLQMQKIRLYLNRPAAPWVGLGLLLLFHLAANLWWLSADNHPIRTDEETHMQMARNYYEALFMHSDLYRNPIERIVAVSKIEPGQPAHPPLLHIAGALMIAVFGYSVDVIAGANTIFFLWVILGCFFIARRFLGRWESLFCAFVVSFTPLVFVASRFFMTDYLSLAIVVWVVYVLLRCDRFLSTPWVFAFAILNGLGVLARTTTFLYYLLPCLVVVGSGFLIAIRWKDSRKPDWTVLRRWLFNVIMAAIVSLGICSPWYFRHVDRFYTYWSIEHRPGSGGPVALAESGDEQLVKNPAQEGAVADAANKPSAPVAKKASTGYLGRLMKLTVRPEVPWKRYPFFIINNGTFLFLFLIGVAGIVIAFRHRDYQVFPVKILLLWVLGSWILLTVLLSFSTARYTLQFLPAFALLAAMALLAIRDVRARRTALWAVSGLLLLQYGNLTFHNYGPLAQIQIPITVDAYMQREYNEPGLYVFKPQLTLGFSYANLSAPVQDNFKDRIFNALLKSEKGRPFRQGEDANYLRLNMRGMVFDEQHYWPDSPEYNPFRRKDIPADLMPVRRFRSIGWGRTPAEIEAVVRNVDYVVYAIEADRPQDEESWQIYLNERGFELVDRFFNPRMGLIPARYFAVFSRKQTGNVIEIRGMADIDKLNLYDLYAFKNSSEFARAPQTVKDHTLKRFTELIDKEQPTFQINEYLTFITAAVTYEEGFWYQFRFVFKVHKAIPENLRMYFHGKPEVTDVGYLPEDKRAQGYMDWNFDPAPPMMNWPVGDYVVISHRINAERIPYFIKLGFFNRKEGFWGSAIQLGWVDFSKIETRKPTSAAAAPNESE